MTVRLRLGFRMGSGSTVPLRPGADAPGIAAASRGILDVYMDPRREEDDTLRGPLGLVLSGGGSHGAWQAGCLEALRAAGLEFDKVVGFSIGSITGASYFLGEEKRQAETWRQMDRLRLLRFRPRLQRSLLFPVSLFASEPLREALSYAHDEAENKRRGRCEFTVVAHRLRDRVLEYARFTPGGSAGWDGPLYERLLASCAVPMVFPPVRMNGGGGNRLLVDGGLPAREPMHFEAVAGCRDVIALQMTRPEEIGRLGPWLRRGFDQLLRDISYKTISAGLEPMLRAASPPRVFRLFPSKVLDYPQLDFAPRHCSPAYDLGRRDGEAFLAAPLRWETRGPRISPSNSDAAPVR